MYRNGRNVIPDFDLDERLYYRFTKSGADLEQVRLLPAAIHLPECSVNRSLFSPPEWVLIPCYAGYGIAFFVAGDLPPSYTVAEDKFSFAVEHVPEDANYSHSLIRVLKNHTPDKSFKSAKKRIILKELQNLLSKKSRIQTPASL
jgi:hypothetical protein